MKKKPDFLRLVKSDFEKSVDADASFVRFEGAKNQVTDIRKKTIAEVLPRLMTASGDARMDLYFYLIMGEMPVTREGEMLLAATKYGQRGAAWDKAVYDIINETFRMESGGTHDFTPSKIINRLTPEEWADMQAKAADVPNSGPKPQEP